MANHNSYFGKNNSNWKGSDKKLSERAKHYRIVAKRGLASSHICARCRKRKAMDWAEQKDGSYKPLCRACHNAIDGKIDNIQSHDPRYK